MNLHHSHTTAPAMPPAQIPARGRDVAVADSRIDQTFRWHRIRRMSRKS